MVGTRAALEPIQLVSTVKFFYPIISLFHSPIDYALGASPT